MFTFGAIGAYLGGLVGDRTGLQVVLQGSAGIAVATTLLSLVLRPEVKAEAAHG